MQSLACSAGEAHHRVVREDVVRAVFAQLGLQAISDLFCRLAGREQGPHPPGPAAHDDCYCVSVIRRRQSCAGLVERPRQVVARPLVAAVAQHCAFGGEPFRPLVSSPISTYPRLIVSTRSVRSSHTRSKSLAESSSSTNWTIKARLGAIEADDTGPWEGSSGSGCPPMVMLCAPTAELVIRVSTRCRTRSRPRSSNRTTWRSTLRPGPRWPSSPREMLQRRRR